MSTNLKNISLYIGYIAILASAILMSTAWTVMGTRVSLPLMILGVGIITIYRCLTPLTGKDRQRIIRLQVQLFISTIAYIACIYFIYANDSKWILALLIAALIDFIVASRIPNE